MSHQLWHYDADTKRRESIPSFELTGIPAQARNVALLALLELAWDGSGLP